MRARRRLLGKRARQALWQVRSLMPALTRTAPVGFFVIGAGRGGTSLLAALLDAHPRLAMGFEFESVNCLKGEAVPGDESGEKRATIARDRLRVFGERCRFEAGRHRGRLWGNKVTTEQIFGLEDHNTANPERPVDVLQLFFREEFPDAKIVFILRDGRTCVRSKVLRTRQSVEVACERWRYSVRVLEYLRTCGSAVHDLKYEALVSSPEAELERVCNFLEVPMNRGMLEGTRSPKLRSDYRAERVHRLGIQLEGVPDGCERALEAELRACGYLEATP